MSKIKLPGPADVIVQSRGYKWWVYLAVAVGTYFTVVDQAGVNIAMPSLSNHFSLDIPTVQWVLLIYVLTTSIMFMPFGRLADIVGRRKVFLLGFVFNIVGAAIGGFAPLFPMILVGKVIQGIGVACIQANALAIITTAFPDRERGKAIGLYSTIIGTGLTSGPIIGGLLVNWFSWRAVFLANIPASLLALTLAGLTFKPMAPNDSSGGSWRTFDWAGAALSSGAVIGLLLGMSNGHKYGWNSPIIIASFSAAAVLFSLFVWWQIKTQYPMLDLALFKSKVFSIGTSARFINFLATSSIAFLIPFYIINVLGYSPAKAGLVMVPGAMCMALLGPISGRLSDLFGSRYVSTAGQIFAILAVLTFSQLSIDSSPYIVLIGLILAGTGAGLFNPSNNVTILSHQDQSKFGIVVALSNVIRTTANVSGIAVATTIVTVTMAGQGYEPNLSAVTGVGAEAVKNAFLEGLNRAYMVGAGILLISTTLSALRGAESVRSSSIG